MFKILLISALCIALTYLNTDADAETKSVQSGFKSVITNEDFFNFMAEGKSELDVELAKTFKTYVPDDFWTLPSKQAAIALAEANLPEDKKKKYHFVIDDSATPTLPKSFSIAVSASGGHWVIRPNYFLRVDPERSYLAYSGSTRTNPWLTENPLDYSAPGFDFWICDLHYESALIYGSALWQLAHGRLEPDVKNESEESISTCDGLATIHFMSNDGTVALGSTAWVGLSVSSGWTGSFGSQQFNGLVYEIFSEDLPGRLRGCVPNCDERNGRFISANNPTDFELKLHKTTKELIDNFSFDQNKISYLILEDVVRAAGHLEIEDLHPKINEINRLLSEKQTLDLNCDKYSKSRSSKMEANPTECDLMDLKESISIALKRYTVSKNPELLSQWFRTREDGWEWALWQLKHIDKEEYVSALDFWYKEANSEDKPYILQLISAANMQHAVGIAKTISPSDDNKLFVAAFKVLFKAKQNEEILPRANSLLELTLSDSIKEEIRQEIIRVLVPKEDPLFLTNDHVDSALIQILEKPSKNGISWDYNSKPDAVRALSSRTGTRYLVQMFTALNTVDSYYYSQILKVIATLANQMNQQQKSEFAQVIRMNLTETYGMLNDLSLIAWVADLRMLDKELERIASQSPESYEWEKCDSESSEKAAVIGKCHSPRKILAIWNEKNPLRRFKFLLSFYLQSPYEFDSGSDIDSQYRFMKLQSEIRECINLLKGSQKKVALGFLTWSDSNYPFTSELAYYNDQRKKVFEEIRSLLAQ